MQESGPSLDFDEARLICLLQVVKPEDFACVQLVYGYAGWWAAGILYYTATVVFFSLTTPQVKKKYTVTGVHSKCKLSGVDGRAFQTVKQIHFKHTLPGNV